MLKQVMLYNVADGKVKIGDVVYAVMNGSVEKARVEHTLTWRKGGVSISLKRPRPREGFPARIKMESSKLFCKLENVRL